jgi:hypothetical protein
MNTHTFLLATPAAACACDTPDLHIGTLDREVVVGVFRQTEDRTGASVLRNADGASAAFEPLDVRAVTSSEPVWRCSSCGRLHGRAAVDALQWAKDFLLPEPGQSIVPATRTPTLEVAVGDTRVDVHQIVFHEGPAREAWLAGWKEENDKGTPANEAAEEMADWLEANRDSLRWNGERQRFE